MANKTYFTPGGRRASAPVRADGKPVYAVPAGYQVQWPHASFDLLKKVDVKRTGPAWLVTCNAHGQILAAGVTSGPKGDKAGSAAGRKTWCKGCKAA